MQIDNSSVIRAFPGSEIPEQSLTLESERFNFCDHGKIGLNEHDRSVKCAKCGKVFDPFHFLQTEVARLHHAWRQHAEVRQNLSELIERVEVLKKEEARFKSRIKTAKAKTEPVFSTRSREL